MQVATRRFALCPSSMKRSTSNGWKTSTTGASRGSFGGAIAYPRGIAPPDAPVVHLAAALVGPSHTRVAFRPLPQNHGGARRSYDVRALRLGRDHAGD